MVNDNPLENTSAQNNAPAAETTPLPPQTPPRRLVNIANSPIQLEQLVYRWL